MADKRHSSSDSLDPLATKLVSKKCSVSDRWRSLSNETSECTLFHLQKPQDF